MSHVLYLLIKSASGADGIWEQHILIRKSKICISERENERGKRGREAEKILGVLALINWLTFCPVCWLTGRDIRMEHRGEPTVAELQITPSSSWWLICSFHLPQVFGYRRKSMKRKHKGWRFILRPIYNNDMWRKNWVGVANCLNSSHSAQRLLSCGDAVNANWAIARPCFTAGLEAVQHYCFLQVTAPLAVRLSLAAVAGEKRAKL